ncbi:MAG: hypothetical protein M0Z96_02385 [Actinomycetota bacterium]|nr:hypothetical protein [Actinomycetota bacterium]
MGKSYLAGFFCGLRLRWRLTGAENFRHFKVRFRSRRGCQGFFISSESYCHFGGPTFKSWLWLDKAHMRLSEWGSAILVKVEA